MFMLCVKTYYIDMVFIYLWKKKLMFFSYQQTDAVA